MALYSFAPTLRAFSSGPHRSTGASEKLCFDDGRPGLARSQIEQTAWSATRAGCAPIGAPRTRRADDGKVRRMAHRKCASSPQAHGRAVGEPRRPLANLEHMDVLKTCSRGGLLFGDFLLAKQEKVTRAPGRGAEQDRDVEPNPQHLRKFAPIRLTGTFPRKRGKANKRTARRATHQRKHARHEDQPECSGRCACSSHEHVHPCYVIAVRASIASALSMRAAREGSDCVCVASTGCSCE